MEFKDRLNWSFISSYKKLETKDLRQWKYKLNWRNISRNQKLTEDQIFEFSDLLDKDQISSWQKLTEHTMEEMFSVLNIEYLACYQNLSEKFIEKHFDAFKPYINFIARHQKLSAKFVWKYIDILDIAAMAQNGKINMNLREKFQYLVRTEAVPEWHDYWHSGDYDPCHENHNLQNKAVIKWLNIEVEN